MKTVETMSSDVITADDHRSTGSIWVGIRVVVDDLMTNRTSCLQSPNPKTRRLSTHERFSQVLMTDQAKPRRAESLSKPKGSVLPLIQKTHDEEMKLTCKAVRILHSSLAAS